MLVLAHSGAGATWQALLVLASFGLIVVFGLAVVGRLRLREPGDLVLPLAASAVLASLSGTTAGFLSDWVGWWFPLGFAALVAVLVAAFTNLVLSPTSPLAVGAVVVGLAGSLVLHTPIENAWHPSGNGFGEPWEDVTMQVVSPRDGDTVEVGPLEVIVVMSGGTVGLGPTNEPPVGDPEEGGVVHIFLDGSLVTGEDGLPIGPEQDCSTGCIQANYRVELERGVHVLSMEFRTSDGKPFDTPVGGRQTVKVLTIEAE